MTGEASLSVDGAEILAVTAEAIEAAYSRRARQLWSFARRLGLDAASAEDVMQEAFLRAALQPQGSIVDLDAWLFRVVHNLSVDHTRRHVPPIQMAESEVPSEVSSSDELLSLWQQVDLLPERQRLVIYLRFRADLDFQTIARVLGISEGGARANGARGLDSLRRWTTEK